MTVLLGLARRYRALQWGVALAAAIALLQGCFHADRFTLDVAIGDTGRIDLSFDGELIYLPGLIAAEGERAETERALSAAMARIAADPATRRLVRHGDRLHLTYRLRVILENGQSYAFPPVGPPVLTIAADGEGGLTLRGLALPFEVQRAAERTGLGFSGAITIAVGSAYTIVEHSGDPSAPRRHGWSITSFRDPVPFLRLVPDR